MFILKRAICNSGSRVEMMMRTAANTLKSIQQYHCQKLATYVENRVTDIAYAAHALDVELAILTPQYSRIQVSRSCLLLRLLEELKKQKAFDTIKKNTNSFRHFFIICSKNWVKIWMNCLILLKGYSKSVIGHPVRLKDLIRCYVLISMSEKALTKTF